MLAEAGVEHLADAGDRGLPGSDRDGRLRSAHRRIVQDPGVEAT
jgi:hypothetical protein